MKVAVTGIKPTQEPHLGNYFGAIRPAQQLVEDHRGIFFIADYHALTTIRDPEALRTHVYDVAASWLACGLDPDRVLLFRQSDVPEHCELAWVLSCLLATGQLERGHAYKDALARGESPNAGIFNYPVLMAADILLYDADRVPVGRDQVQHLELARDAAARLNHLYGDDLVKVPEALISEAPLVPGLDGRKMSKSYGNTIPLFAPAAQLQSTVMKIVTGSEGLDEPKEAEGSSVFQLYSLVASEEAQREMATRLRQGGYGWGHAKQALAAALETQLAPLREHYQYLRRDEANLDALLEQGAKQARQIARRTMRRIRSAIGIGPAPSANFDKTVRMKL